MEYLQNNKKIYAKAIEFHILKHNFNKLNKNDKKK